MDIMVSGRSIRSYDDFADEYYEPRLHPTCANFREASSLLLAPWLQVRLNECLTLCEVGAGKSLCAELVKEREPASYGSMLLVDSSVSMLRHSETLRSSNVHLLAADANELPLRDESFDLVVSVLGDSYNAPAFWREFARILRAGGYGFFTTPSYEWSLAFRSGSEKDLAWFKLADGSQLAVPSLILDQRDQIALIEEAGLRVKDSETVDQRALTSAISSKLIVAVDQPIVTGYAVFKP